MGDSFWEALESEAGVGVLPRAVRTFIEGEGYPAEWERVSDPEERRDLARRAALAVANLEAAGLIPVPGERLSVDDLGAESKDPRWLLLAQLDARLARQSGAEPDWSPLTVGHVSGGAGLPTEERLVLSVDPQVPLRHLVGQLTRLWPKLQERGWRRRTRPLGDRAAALVRFVCLENEPGTPWAELWRHWNKVHPGSVNSYTDQVLFRAEFHRIEKQVSGRKHGLSVFYTHETPSYPEWLAWRLGDVVELARQGDPKARRGLLKLARSLEDEMAQRQGKAESSPRQGEAKSSRPHRREASRERSRQGTSGTVGARNVRPATSGTAPSPGTASHGPGQKGRKRSEGQTPAETRKASGGAA